MAKQNLTAKSWLRKSNTTNAAKYSAYGFLEASKEFLTTGELAPIVSPILAKLDVDRAQALAELRDTEAMTRASLKEIQHAVLAHIVALDVHKQEVKVEEAQDDALQGQQTSTSKKNWIASVVDENGVIQTRIKNNGDVEELVKKFERSQDADRWLQRRLFENASDTVGLVDHVSLNVHTVMTRDEAVSTILAKKKQPVMWQRSKTTKSLSFTHKATEKRISFSRG